MDKSSIGLSFQCQKNWETMTPTKGGRFCVDCKKTVTDFSKIPLHQLNTIVSTNNKVGACGQFRAIQLDRPFDDWRDKIIYFHQKISLTLSVNKHSRQLMLLLMTVLLVTTGCYRHLRGRMKFDSCKHKKHKHKTTQSALPPKEKK